MLKHIRVWVARYDAWCGRMGFVPENRRCCAPVRYDEEDARHPANRAARRQATQKTEDEQARALD